MNANLDFQTSTYSNKTGKVDNSDERVNMDEFWIRNTHELYGPLKKCFVNAINMYMTDHPYFSVQHLTDFRINKYSEVGSCLNTMMVPPQSWTTLWISTRATVLLYLNEDYEGGEFTVATKTLKPKARSVVFPSNFMYPHQARGCHQRNTLEYCIMVDVKTHMCFPTSIHEIKMNMNKNDRKNMTSYMSMKSIYFLSGVKDDLHTPSITLNHCR